MPQSPEQAVRRHFAKRYTIRLSKNYNSAGAEVEFGSDSMPGESTDALIARVSAIAERETESTVKEVIDLLESQPSTKGR